MIFQKQLSKNDSIIGNAIGKKCINQAGEYFEGDKSQKHVGKPYKININFF